MAFLPVAQLIFVNVVPFIRTLIFSDSPAAIRFLPNVVNNSGNVRKYRHCFYLLSGHFSVTLTWVPGHSNIPRSCRADESTTAGLLKQIGNTLSLNQASNRAQYSANLYWHSEQFCSTARLTQSLLDRRCTNQLLGLGLYVCLSVILVSRLRLQSNLT